MEINLTLFVQMFNFVVAWLLLRTLYFKPAIDFITHTQKEHDRLIDKLCHRQSVITAKEHEIKQLWTELKLFSKSRRPSVVDTNTFVNSSPSSSVQVEVIDKKQIETLIKEVKEAVIQGASHVDV